jgi:hypothetical protein
VDLNSNYRHGSPLSLGSGNSGEFGEVGLSKIFEVPQIALSKSPKGVGDS